MSCKWVSNTEPRVVPGRHRDDCADRWGDDAHGCQGCLPCREPHCRVCRRTHADGTCAECLASTRSDLRGIAILCGALPEEVEHRGIGGEAMVLLGPVSDPEAWGHVTASVAAGRLSREWVEEGGGEMHPLTVLLTWQMVYRDALEHDDAKDAELSTAIDYLDRNLSYLAEFEWVPFEDFARDLRRCVAHLEAVLHDGEQIDRGAPCMKCKVPLVREWGRFAAADGWRCPKCREWRSDADYRLNVADLHRGQAEWLTDRDLQTKTGVSAGRIRVWASRGLVARKRDSGRTVYDVAAVMKRAGLAS